MLLGSLHNNLKSLEALLDRTVDVLFTKALRGRSKDGDLLGSGR